MAALEQPGPSGYAFPRAHRLKRRRLIRPLFDRSRSDVRSVAVGCVRLLFRTVAPEDVGVDVPLQIGFAPGRRVGTAVVRNRIKRILREVYRVNQHLLIDLFSRRAAVLTVMVLFRGHAESASDCIPHDLPKALRRVAAHFDAEDHATPV